jgi:mRNA interferase MazF
MAKRPASVAFPRRGNVYIVNCDPLVGSEIAKTRPAVVIQNDISNRYSAVTIVAAISSQITNPPYPNEVLVRAPEGGLKVDSSVRLNQIRTVDKQRLRKHVGKLSPATMRRVDQAIRNSLGLISLVTGGHGVVEEPGNTLQVPRVGQFATVRNRRGVGTVHVPAGSWFNSEELQFHPLGEGATTVNASTTAQDGFSRMLP